MAVLSYKIYINTPGRYYVWIRSCSTGSEDNGVHVGIAGKWPESGKRWQTVRKLKWAWECKQRTQKVHTGVPMQLFLDIEKAGDHELMLSMREDGFEMDKIVLSRHKEFKPEGKGPAVQVKSGVLPKPFPEVTEPVSDPDKNKEAKARTWFPYPSGKYNITLHVVGESDGQSTFQVAIGETKVGDFIAPLGTQTFVEGPQFSKTWKDVTVRKESQVIVSSQIASVVDYISTSNFKKMRWTTIDWGPIEKPSLLTSRWMAVASAQSANSIAVK